MEETRKKLGVCGGVCGEGSPAGLSHAQHRRPQKLLS